MSQPQLYRLDGKKPDEISVAPWKSGKSLLWNATCLDTLAPLASTEAGLVAAQAPCISCCKVPNSTNLCL